MRPELEYRQVGTRVDAGGALNVFPAPVTWSPWTRVPYVDINEDPDVTNIKSESRCCEKSTTLAKRLIEESEGG